MSICINYSLQQILNMFAEGAYVELDGTSQLNTSLVPRPSSPTSLLTCYSSIIMQTCLRLFFLSSSKISIEGEEGLGTKPLKHSSTSMVVLVKIRVQRQITI